MTLMRCIPPMVSSTCSTRIGSFPLSPNAVRRSSRGRVKVPCGRIWPNGEFGLSWQYKDEELEAPRTERAGGVSLEHMRLMSLIMVLEREYLKAVGMTALYPWLVKSPKLAQRPETYGRKGLTPYGSKVVRNGAYLLQEKYGKGRLSFATFTLPPLGQKDLGLVAARWGYLLKTLLQALRRMLQARSLPESIVLVTELQSRRLEARDLGALHVHLVFVGRHRHSAWEYTPFQYKSTWLRLISNILGKPLDCYPCENVQRVERDASNYLSKYMSKGAGDIAEYAEIEGWDKVPRQWWSATQTIKKAVKKRTVSGEQSSRILDALLHNYWKKGGVPNTEGVVFSRPITVEATKYQDLVIGYFGKIDKPTYQDIYDLSVSYRDSLVSSW